MSNGDRALAVGGLYEICIGTRDADAAATFWRAFGYELVDDVRLEATAAFELYGCRSGARAIRLRAKADHGLIRLWQWDEPTNAGLGMRGLRFDGNRWTGQFTRSVLTIANHAASAAKAGAEMVVSQLHYIDMGAAYAHLFGGRLPQPFVDPLISLREFQLFRPETRQVFLERFGYDSPLLGTFADDSLLRTTQIVQGCMLVRSDDPNVFGFYERVLGLWRSFDHAVPYEEAQASREVFELRPGETHWNVDLDEPASKPTLEGRRSGRLKCFRFPAASPMEMVHELASPGAIGLSNYTWRVADVREAHSRATAEGATVVTRVMQDEFGQEAFSFRAPDGYFWTFVQA